MAEVIDRNPVHGKLYWYVCHSCGWEALTSDGVRNSRGCGNPECWTSDLHVHSNADGELPKRLPKHHSGCGNQNAAHPEGAYGGAEDCSVCKDWK